jgi:23S rRNA (guanosine2251-2'-O)-methyltransferase
MQRFSLIYGIHAVSALLTRSPWRVERLCVQQSSDNENIRAILTQAESLRLPIKRLSKEAFTRLLPDCNHQGIAAERLELQTFTEHDLPKFLNHLNEQPFFLVLDGVQDPHNLGACLRSADAAGVHAVIIPKDKSVGLTPTVAKVACGAAETVPLVMATNLVRALRFLQKNNVWCIGFASEAETSIHHFDLKGPLALVLGGEESGLRRLTSQACDQLLSIPMRGQVESLNVSVATGVALFESVRQRGRR